MKEEERTFWLGAWKQVAVRLVFVRCGVRFGWRVRARSLGKHAFAAAVLH